MVERHDGVAVAATYEHQVELASSYPDAQIVTIANVGHKMIWEKPDEYIAHVRAYFDEIGFEGGVR